MAPVTRRMARLASTDVANNLMHIYTKAGEIEERKEKYQETLSNFFKLLGIIGASMSHVPLSIEDILTIVQTMLPIMINWKTLFWLDQNE